MLLHCGVYLSSITLEVGGREPEVQGVNKHSLKEAVSGYEPKKYLEGVSVSAD